MKKIALTVAVLALGLAGCGGRSGEGGNEAGGKAGNESGPVRER